MLKDTLRGISCNNRMYASALRIGNWCYSARYHCGKCKTPSLAAGLVHDDSQEMLQRIKPSGGIPRLYKDDLVRKANEKLGRINDEVQKLRDELVEVSRWRIQAIEKFAARELTKDEKCALVDSLDTRKQDISFNLKKPSNARVFERPTSSLLSISWSRSISNGRRLTSI